MVGHNHQNVSENCLMNNMLSEVGLLNTTTLSDQMHARNTRFFFFFFNVFYSGYTNRQNIPTSKA